MSVRDRQPTQPRNAEPTPWRPPTRRVFVSMLGAAAAALVVRGPARLGSAAEEPVRPKSTTMWIGHC